jgi:hypothetical protein
MTATARFCPCLLASSSSRTSFSRCSIILRCLSIRQKKSHRVPSQSRDGGCDQRASRFASSLWPVNGKRGFKTTRGLHRKSEPASDAACCAWCRSDRPLLPSGHLNSVNFHRVTLHCEFGVSPLEIGGFGAVPPSPPDSSEKRAAWARFFMHSARVALVPTAAASRLSSPAPPRNSRRAQAQSLSSPPASRP